MADLVHYLALAFRQCERQRVYVFVAQLHVGAHVRVVLTRVVPGTDQRALAYERLLVAHRGDRLRERAHRVRVVNLRECLRTVHQIQFGYQILRQNVWDRGI